MKSTLRFDIREGVVNKKLEYASVKAVSFFLNTEGGILIIGVDDNRNIIGIEKDLQTLPKNKQEQSEYEKIHWGSK